MDAGVKDGDVRVHDDGEPEVVLAPKAEPPPTFTPEDEEVKQASIPPARFWSLCLGIGVEFEVLENVNWVALAYTLAYLGCAIVFARVSDIVGRRDAFIAAYIIFFVFSLACGFAQTMNQLIAFRALQGIGGSGKSTNVLS
ncbi:hypothetical protein NW762_008589 [Fusarium torreyae]|uniref:Major facilitator superfamily (MFS) profile domain-containing protein n=1 Tax=Fusarium torreyae TaxID=1237075 RepID=A0A9W8RVD0_9HYPO|nr:hypothetical protein NW762_008589 [Fusarium torreyae]